jgi:hypothetical protein
MVNYLYCLSRRRINMLTIKGQVRPSAPFIDLYHRINRSKIVLIIGFMLDSLFNVR